MIRLYSAARSSASFRVRIALNLKGLDYDYVAVDLRGGEQLGAAFRTVNPAALVPVLEIDGQRLVQSLAILEYLEETRPEPPLLPREPAARARVRAAALAIACDIHPLNNLRVLGYLGRELAADEAARNAWYRHWVVDGLAQLEAQVRAGGAHGRFIEGDRPGLADLCLVPQIFNARRFDARLDHVPLLMGIFDECMALPAFAAAQWERQPDFAG